MDAVATGTWVDLTSRQLSIWLELQTAGHASSYQIGGYTRIERPLDPRRFVAAVALVAAQHEALRLEIDPNEPRQRVRAAIETPVDVVDLSGESDPEATFFARAEKAFVTPFELDGGPLFHITLVRISDRLWYTLLRCHHLIIDGLSIPLFVSLLSQAYQTLGGEAAGELGHSTYLDFVGEDAAYRTSPRAAKDLDFWSAHLSPLPEPVFTPRAVAAEGYETASSMLVRWDLPRADYARFLAACADAGARPLQVLAALVGALVHDLSAEDVVVGIAVPGRGRGERTKVGMFNGAMPLRLRVAPGATLADLFVHAGRQLAQAYRCQRAPIDAICRRLEVGRRRRRGIFEVFMSYIPADVAAYDYELDGERIEPVILRGPEANPLGIYISESDRERAVMVEFAFNPLYLDRDGAELLMARFQRLLATFAAAPRTALQDLALFTPQERARLCGARPEPEEQGDAARTLRIVASFTAEPLAGPLRYWLDLLGIEGRLAFAEYNQLFQELLNPASETRANRTGANLVLLRVEDWLRYREGGAGAAADRAADAAFVAETGARFIEALATALAGAQVPYLIAVCPPSRDWSPGGRFDAVQAQAEAALARAAAALPGLHLVSYAATRVLYPCGPEWDAEGDRLGHVPLTSAAFAATATALARRLHFALRRKSKVVVVDCDNTLWDGVVGEDGVEGLRLSPAHLDLQRRLVAAVEGGMLVCLCSKNTEQDVLDVFARRADMVLSLDRVVSHRINWQPKSQNIRALAEELELGLDSFVFIDDNPVEIAEVEAACPGVVAIPFAAEGAAALKAEHLWLLDVGAATAEDARRTVLYRENAQRVKLKEATGDFAAFIASLGLDIRVAEPADADLARLEQLTERTNQFNINAVRRTAGAFAAARGVPGRLARAVFVKDRFGDYGLVGALMARADGPVLEVETLLMSCRVLGRGVEHAMIAELGRAALAFGCDTVRLETVVAPRNQPVRQFLSGVPGPTTPAGDRAVTLIGAQAAAAYAFRPQEAALPAAVAETSQDAPARAAPAAVPPLSGALWRDIASRLAGVDAIAEAVRASTSVERASATLYRAPRTALEQHFAQEFAKLLGLDRVGIDDNVFELGLTSLLAVQFVAHVRTACNVQLAVRSLFENATIAKLAGTIDRGEITSSYSALVPLQAGDGSEPLFCIHPANGDAVSFMRLAKALGPDQTVYGLEAQGLGPGEPMATSVEEMAQAYIAEIRTVKPHGPYHLLGWSFGGPVAYEMARRLKAQGESVGQLIFMDCPTPYGRDEPNLDYEEVLRIFAEDMESLERRLERPTPLKSTTNRSVTIQEVIAAAQRMGVAPPEYSEAEAKRKVLVYTNCVSLFRRWHPPQYDGDIHLFRAIKQDPRIPYDWDRHTTGRVTVRRIRCNHVRIGFEPFVGIVAKEVRRLLRGEAEAPRAWWERALVALKLRPVAGERPSVAAR